jgi:hypothetical protein
MNRANSGVPGDDFDSEQIDARLNEVSDPDEREEQFRRFDEVNDYEGYDEQEPLRRQLAQFAFVREEDDREVRLTFRDVPADEIARAFRGSGALLISMMGERALAPPAMSASPSSVQPDLDITSQESVALQDRKKRTHKRLASLPYEDMPASARPSRHIGELTTRYFFALGDLVYTINIISPTGIVESIAGIFPAAAQSEHELQSRLAAVFREKRSQTP